MLNTILAGFYDDLMKQITQSTAKENIEMQFEQHGKKLEEWVWEFRRKAEQEIQFPETGPDQPIPPLEQIGREKLAELDCAIAKIGNAIFDHVLNGLKHIAYRDELVQSIMEYSGMRAQEFAGNTAEPMPPNTENPEPPENAMPPHGRPEDDPIRPPEDDQLNMDGPLPEQTPVPEPKKKSERKSRKKAKPEFKTLPKHPVTGNERRDRLESALHDALERLNNTKMAFHFRKVKMVRQALEELYKAAGGSDEERINLLETGLKDAVNILTNSPRAASSKAMQDIWQNIIVALQEVDDDDK